MWKQLGLAGGSVAAVTLLAGSALPTAGVADDKEREPRDFRVKVVTDTDNEFFVNNPPRGESPGDVFGFTANLRKHGERVGRAAITCTLMSKQESLCTGAVHLYGKGQITLQVLLDARTEDERFRVPITGGSGKFKGADGQMVVIDPPGPREWWKFDFTR